MARASRGMQPISIQALSRVGTMRSIALELPRPADGAGGPRRDSVDFPQATHNAIFSNNIKGPPPSAGIFAASPGRARVHSRFKAERAAPKGGSPERLRGQCRTEGPTLKRADQNLIRAPPMTTSKSLNLFVVAEVV